MSHKKINLNDRRQPRPKKRYALLVSDDSNPPFKSQSVAGYTRDVGPMLDSSRAILSGWELLHRSKIVPVNLEVHFFDQEFVLEHLPRIKHLAELTDSEEMAKQLRLVVVADPKLTLDGHLPDPEFFRQPTTHVVGLHLRNSDAAHRCIEDVNAFDLAHGFEERTLLHWLHDVSLDIAVFHSIPALRPLLHSRRLMDDENGSPPVSMLKLFALQANRPSDAARVRSATYCCYAHLCRQGGVIDWHKYRTLWEEFLQYLQEGCLKMDRQRAEALLFDGMFESLLQRGHISRRRLRAQFRLAFDAVQAGDAAVAWFALLVLTRRSRDPSLKAIFGTNRPWSCQILAYQPSLAIYRSHHDVDLFVFPLAKLQPQSSP